MISWDACTMNLPFNGVKSLHKAIFHGELAEVNRLVANGVSVNALRKGNTAFTLAAAVIIVDERRGSPADWLKVRYFIANIVFTSAAIDPNARSKNGRRPLHEAASIGRADWLETLIAAGANVRKLDAEGLSPLAVAVRRDKEACVRSLLRHGADVNQTDKDGWTLLQRASAALASGTAAALLEHGCYYDGLDILTLALQKFSVKKLPNLLQLCNALRHAGYDFDSRNAEGRSALELMVVSNNVYGVCLLAESGCHMDAQFSGGCTAFEEALYEGPSWYELARHLLYFGANGEPDINTSNCKVFSYFRTPFSYVLNYLESSKIRCCGDLKNVKMLLETLLECTYPLTSYADFTRSSLADPYASDGDEFMIQKTVAMRAVKLTSMPCSLLHQSKLRIRRGLGSIDTPHKINRLPLPANMKRYLNLDMPLHRLSLYQTVRLHAAVMGNNLDLVRQTIRAGASVQFTLAGRSALGLALLYRRDDAIVSEILSQLKPPTRPENADDDRLTLRSLLIPSTAARTRGEEDIAKLAAADRFLASQEPLWSFSDEGDSPLHLVAKARGQSHVTAAVNLCRSGHLHALNLHGYTALEEAVLASHGLPGVLWAEDFVEQGATALASLSSSSSSSSSSSASSPTTTTTNAEGTSSMPSLSDLGITVLHLASAAGDLRLAQLCLRSRRYGRVSRDRFGNTPQTLAQSEGEAYTRLESGPTRRKVEHCLSFITASQRSPSDHSGVVLLLQG